MVEGTGTGEARVEESLMDAGCMNGQVRRLGGPARSLYYIRQSSLGALRAMGAPTGATSWAGTVIGHERCMACLVTPLLAQLHPCSQR